MKLTKALCSFLAPLLVCFKLVNSYEHGFSNATCDSMEPEIDADSPLHLSSEPSPFKISTNETKYRRGRTLQVSVTGPTFQAMLLEIRQTTEAGVHRVGDFTKWPEYMQPLQCDKGRNTAVTNRDDSNKTDPTFTWKAPDDDMGNLEVVGTFVSGEDYWLAARMHLPLVFNDFPINMAECGRVKGCFRHLKGASDCTPDTCDYVFTHQLSDDNQTVTIVLGGTTEPNHYVGIGFAKNEKLENMEIYTCSRSADGVNMAVKEYRVLNWDDEPTEQSPVTQNSMMDVEGGRLWCQFERPTLEPGVADLTIPLYQVYMWGEVNTTSLLPILDTKLVSAGLVRIGEPTDIKHPSSAPAIPLATVLTILTTLALSCHWL